MTVPSTPPPHHLCQSGHCFNSLYKLWNVVYTSVLLLHVGAEMFSLWLVLQGPQLGPVRIWRCHLSLSRCSSGEMAPPVAQSKTLEPFQPPNPLCILTGSIHRCPLPSPLKGTDLIQPCLGHVDSLTPTLCPGFHRHLLYRAPCIAFHNSDPCLFSVPSPEFFCLAEAFQDWNYTVLPFYHQIARLPCNIQHCQAFKILLGVRITPSSLSAWESNHTYLC